MSGGRSTICIARDQGIGGTIGVDVDDEVTIERDAEKRRECRLSQRDSWPFSGRQAVTGRGSSPFGDNSEVYFGDGLAMNVTRECQFIEPSSVGLHTHGTTLGRKRLVLDPPLKQFLRHIPVNL